MTPDEVASLWVTGDDAQTPTPTGALDALKKRMQVPNSTQADSMSEPDVTKKEDNKQASQKSLVEKIKRYTVDEHGHDASKSDQPLYVLESVAEILKHDSDEAIKRLSKKYDISFDDLGRKKTITETKKDDKNDTSVTESQPPADVTPTPAFEQMVSDAEKRESEKLFESLFPNDDKKSKPDTTIPDISDIDTHEIGVSADNQSNTATIRFTPVTNSHGNTDHITISNVTQHIDLDDSIPEDISSHSVTQLEQSEFENFIPKHEYTDADSGKKLIRRLAHIKRNHFLGAFTSAIMLIALSVFLIPVVYDNIISNPQITMFICVAFLGVSTLANADMFIDFKNIIKKRCSFDILASLSSVFTLSLGLTAALTDNNAYYIILLAYKILLTRAIFML